MVVNLGHLSIVTLHGDQQSSPRKETYDQFLVELKGVQVLVALTGEDWRTALEQHLGSPLHLLQPTSLSIHIDKCLVQNNTTLPKVKVAANLPAVAVNVEGKQSYVT